jgi:hypothetical protein
MSYRALPLECHCGETPESILEVGFTSDLVMVIHYWCSSCRRVLYVSRTFEECRALFPAPEKPFADALFTDAQFLQSLGIRNDE